MFSDRLFIQNCVYVKEELQDACDALQPQAIDSLSLQVQRLTQLSLILDSSPMATGK